MSALLGRQLSSLIEALTDFDPYRAPTFWALAPVLTKLVQAGGLQALMNAELSALVANPYHMGTWSQNEAILVSTPKYSLSLALFDAPRRYIHVLPYLAMYMPISGPISYEVYSVPETYRNDLFDPTVRLNAVGTVLAEPHSVIELDTDRCAYDFKVAGPTSVLRFVSASVRPLEWLFSKSTLQAWQANDAELSSTQLRVAANVLGKIAHQSSIEPLKNLTRHPHHAVRWAAIQNLGRLNRSEALAKIRDAVNDPHPHVRRAAQKTLERLEGKVSK